MPKGTVQGVGERQVEWGRGGWRGGGVGGVPRRAGRASLSDIPPGLSGWPQSFPHPPMLLVFVVFELCHGLYPDQVLLSLVGGPSIFFFSFLAPELECLCLCLLSKVLLCSPSSASLVSFC